MKDLLLSALPEFLGSLCAALVLAAGTRTARRPRTRRARHARRTGPPNTRTAPGAPPSPEIPGRTGNGLLRSRRR
ncbi:MULTISPECIES: hypothetical protein [unclassified Streptomyces]|uniref:hypothetical protein n=1 Tax=unclassified Streptomyces TaxID=2593676 RepID=UPI00166093D9|nr:MULTISPECIES: hypothetical protein [unclassified Streptomyces]